MLQAHSTSFDREAAMHRVKRSRQDPVSCQLCRKKKLKCDRQQPCSNCKARGVSCEPVASQSHRPSEYSTARTTECKGDAAILARRQTLEDIVLRTNGFYHASKSALSCQPTLVAASRDRGEEDVHQAELSTLEQVATQGYSNVSDLRASQEVDRALHQIPNQRCSINAFAHGQRIWLHQQFLIRTSLDPRYTYLRQVCLQSARAVMHVTSLLGSGKSPFRFSSRELLFRYPAFIPGNNHTHHGIMLQSRRRRGSSTTTESNGCLQENRRLQREFSRCGSISGILKDILRKHSIHLRDFQNTAIANEGSLTDRGLEPGQQVLVGDVGFLNVQQEPMNLEFSLILTEHGKTVSISLRVWNRSMGSTRFGS